ncbi:hypothetical protein L7F22_036969 [Adiantum nelumboides]|nr:hypothetical protein [Adiantum nelumboides]
MASGEGQLNPFTSGDAGGDHNEDYGNEYGPPLPTQVELHEMEHRILVGEATNMMLTFAKDPKLAKYMTETAFHDVHAQWKATTTSPPKPYSKKQYSEKELEEEVPQRLYSLADLRLNDIETTRFLSPVDSTLGDVRRNLQIGAVLAGVVVWQTLQPSQFQVLSTFVALLLISGIDLVVNNGGVEALLLDTIARIVSEKYKNRVAQHEAGHFLIAYLLGIIPKSYTLSSLDAYRKEGSLSVQAGTTFVDTQFQEEVKSGKLSAGSLNVYSCIALAGVATEYLLFGVAEGGLADVQQLDRLMRSLNFTQMKADSQVRWAVLNTVTILRRHKGILLKLASAMLSNKSVGECINLIEDELSHAVEV